jgi:hypothetical protein
MSASFDIQTDGVLPGKTDPCCNMLRCARVDNIDRETYSVENLSISTCSEIAEIGRF